MNTPQRPRGEPIRVPVDPDILDLVPLFLDNRRSDVGTLRQALVEGDMETVRQLGHSMKGMGGGYGFDRITELGAVLEDSARVADAASAATALAALDDYLQRVEPYPDPDFE